MSDKPVSRDELVAALSEVLDRRVGVDERRHREDHEFIRMKIEQARRRAEYFQKIKVSAVGAITLAVAGACLSYLGWVGEKALKFLNLD